MGVVTQGWPNSKDKLDEKIKPYWNYREEIILQSGLLYKAERIIIPEELRKEMLDRVHYSHMGIQSCLRRARESIYWPGMNQQIKNLVQECEICLALGTSQRKETMKTHSIPTLPWTRIAMDIFEFKKKHYMVTVDYYSDFFEIDVLEDMTTTTIIEYLKKNFARHGIPKILDTDNAAMFRCGEFCNFSKSWEFSHNTSSPKYSQSNGKVEATVKIAKYLVKKSEYGETDFWKCVLDQRNTPTEGMMSSPAQRLMSRRTRNTLPTKENLLVPVVQHNVIKNIYKKRLKSKTNYNKNAKDMKELQIGDEVFVKDIGNNTNIWKKGIINEKLSDRAYNVIVEGSLYRRNRLQIKYKSRENDLGWESLEADLAVGKELQNKENEVQPIIVESCEQKKQSDDKLGKRQKKTPVKFKDYILY